MIDELVLEQLLDELAQDIPVPAGGADRVVHELSASGRPSRRPSRHATRLLLVAAVLLVIGGLGLAMHASGSGHEVRREALTAGPARAKSKVANGAITPTTMATRTSPPGRSRGDGGFVGNNGPQGNPGNIGPQGVTGAAYGVGGTVPSAPAASGPVDGALIVKSGSLDLQVPHGALRPTVNRVTGVAVGLGGYVANSKTSYDGPDATAQITIRVPVGNFDTAITRINALPGIKVLGDSENGSDVTAQYTNLQARLVAATGERDSLLGVLAGANTIGDILAVRDRIAAVQSEMDTLQGQINLLGNESSYSSLAITLTEKLLPTHRAHAVVHKVVPPTGLQKSWADARQGFSNAVEWLISRSGGALIVLLTALVLIFGLRYLYPILRRALL